MSTKASRSTLPGLLVMLILSCFASALGQTTPSVNFTISPSSFQHGEVASSLVCISPSNTAGTLTFNQNDVSSFVFPTGFGTITSVATPIIVVSASLIPSDFAAAPGASNQNKVVITYTAATSKNFSYGDSICAKVGLTAGNAVGLNQVRFSSKFTGLTGNLPYASISVVDFPAGPAGPPGPAGVSINPIQVAKLQWYGANSTFPDIMLSAKALSIAFDGSNIWVTKSDNTVTKFRSSDGANVGTFPTALIPSGIAFDGTYMWIVSSFDYTISKMRAADGVIVATYPSGIIVPRQIVFDGANMWVTSPAQSMVARIRCSDGGFTGAFSVGSNPSAIAFDGINIWVANAASNDVTKLRSSDGANQGTFATGTTPRGIAFDGVNMWVTNAGGSVTKLRASDGANLGTFAVGANSEGIMFDGANVWVANGISHSVTKLRANDGANLGAFPTIGLPTAIAFDGDKVWAASIFDTILSRL